MIAAVLVNLLLPLAAAAQSNGPKYEFRGAWIATVLNLDWPSRQGLSSAVQQAELQRTMNDLQAAGINAVFFQIRAESDALYESAIEPWSVSLSGIQGLAPDPYYDPLELAIQLAHERGMELHAWFNPFRVERSVGSYALAAGHVAVRHPEWVLEIPSADPQVNNSIALLDPGHPDARSYITDVILDVASRYDIDGVHFDDYFYPYPPYSMGTADLNTYLTYGGDFPTISEWRLNNINEFVRVVSEALFAADPDLKFGISPFGIWRDSVPAGIHGLSSVDVIFSDAVRWMFEGWVDYVAPQLYWPFGGAQDFATLAPWWVSVATDREAFRRHIYPGLAAYRAEPTTGTGTLFSPSEIPSQIRFSRALDGAEGNVLFRAGNIVNLHTQGLLDSLRFDLNTHPALVPRMLWRDITEPLAPRELGGVIPVKRSVGLNWTPPAADPFAPPPRKYAVYRKQSPFAPDPRAMTNDPDNLLAVTYDPWYGDGPPVATDPYWYVVTSLSANSIESAESNLFQYYSTGSDVETVPASSFRIESLFPNPFQTEVAIRLSVERPDEASLVVYDVLGRMVKRLFSGRLERGEYEWRWRGEDATGRALPSGTYFMRAVSGRTSLGRSVVLVR